MRMLSLAPEPACQAQRSPNAQSSMLCARVRPVEGFVSPVPAAFRPGLRGFTMCFVPSVLGLEPRLQASLSLEGGGRGGRRSEGVREGCEGGRDVSGLSHTPLSQAQEKGGTKDSERERVRNKDRRRETETPRRGGRGSREGKPEKQREGGPSREGAVLSDGGDSSGDSAGTRERGQGPAETGQGVLP